MVGAAVTSQTLYAATALSLPQLAVLRALGQPTPIYGQALSPDGTSLVGARTTLITNDQPWEGVLVHREEVAVDVHPEERLLQSGRRGCVHPVTVARPP